MKVIVGSCVASVFLTATLVALEVSPQSRREAIPRGERLYRAHCGRCHGLQGLGGTGPSLARPVLRHARNDEDLADIITNGIAGTGMPGNWMFSPEEVREVASFVRSLGRSDADALSGDPTEGRRVYEEARCATCHIVGGGGSSVGPQLTHIGAQRGTGFLRTAVSHPGLETPLDADGYLSYLVVRVVSARGEEITGRRINEDSFTIQLRDLENRYYSFRKADLRELERQEGRSLMPSYGDALSPSQIEDLVAYLSSLGRER